MFVCCSVCPMHIVFFTRPAFDSKMLLRTNFVRFGLRTAAFVGRLFLGVAPIDDDAFGILGRLAAGRLVQDSFGQFAEGALDVDVGLGRRFHEADVVFAGNLILWPEEC